MVLVVVVIIIVSLVLLFTLRTHSRQDIHCTQKIIGDKDHTQKERKEERFELHVVMVK